MTDEPKVFIYFGTMKSKPIKLYKTEGGHETPTMLQLSEDPDRAAEGLGALYYKSGLIPYSEARWEDCEQFVRDYKERARQNEAQYKALFTGQRTLL